MEKISVIKKQDIPAMNPLIKVVIVRGSEKIEQSKSNEESEINNKINLKNEPKKFQAPIEMQRTKSKVESMSQISKGSSCEFHWI
jgi:hypothetical protein